MAVRHPKRGFGGNSPLRHLINRGDTNRLAQGLAQINSRTLSSTGSPSRLFLAVGGAKVRNCSFVTCRRYNVAGTEWPGGGGYFQGWNGALSSVRAWKYGKYGDWGDFSGFWNFCGEGKVKLEIRLESNIIRVERETHRRLNSKLLLREVKREEG